MLEDLHVYHNTSDGIDLLYLVGSSEVEITRLVAEGNAGNQLKTAGPATVENSLLVGNCSYFSDQPLFQGEGDGDNCRATGGTYSIAMFAGSQLTVTNTTITGEGDCLMDMSCRDTRYNGTDSIVVRNTLYYGHTDWRQPWESACLYYWEDPTLPADLVDFDYNLVRQVKDDLCPGAATVCGQDPRVESGALAGFDGHLLAGSPAVGAGTPTAAPATDLGVVNLGDVEATVEVRVLDAGGRQVGSTQSLAVAAGRWRQQNDVLALVGAGDEEIAYARLAASPAGARVWAYASLVDNATGDPTTIPVVAP